MKVALCIPCHGDTKADFTFSLARLIAYTLRHKPDVEIETLVARSSILVQSRTRLFEWSREWGADFILWLDSDHTFPAGALVRLLELDRPIIGANYRRRDASVYPSAVRRDAWGQWHLVQTTLRGAAASAVEPVDRIGFGFLLMHIETVVKAFGEPLYPLFSTISLANGDFVGEDSLFCDRLRAAGIHIHVDHQISLITGHIAEQTLLFPQ
jgi:hypothetical protein